MEANNRQIRGDKYILLEKPYNKADNNLTVVLATWKDELCTWVYNKIDGSFCWGHYFNNKEREENVKAALDDFNSRGLVQ